MSGNFSVANNKLLTHKSAFQAWKCVAFGCSLLAIVLLLSKWYEVSTDLQLLLNIDRLLTISAQSPNGSLSWPPVPLETLLPAANETSLGMETLDSNGTMLMSHMHISLSRELNGNQLLRAEIGAFEAEFRNAKSTLSLSSLLVSVYIVSWILMTLAINDTRISNDISLRNILLLSVFGAIDMAASVGFVMVRLIMYSVKNHSFASEMLGTVGLRDAPVRLSADQLTSFTALRLIAMRSCSAYIDVYVSVLVALLTLLRLYAILKALTYYKRLRRMTDFQQMMHQREALASSGNDANPAELAEQKPQQIWSANFYGASAGRLAPSSGPANDQQRIGHNAPQADYADQCFRSVPSQTANQTGTFKFHQVGSVRPMSSSKLIVGAARTMSRSNRSRADDLAHLLQIRQASASAQGDRKEKSRASKRIDVHSLATLKKSHHHQQAKVSVSPTIRQSRPSSRHKLNTIASNLLLVNGRTHRLVPEERLDEHSNEANGERVSDRNDLEDSLGLPSERAAEQQQAVASGESEAEATHVFDIDGNSVKSPPRESAASDQELLGAERRRKRSSALNLPVGYNTLRSNGTTYTLLSAQQLDRLDRKLIASTTGGTARAASTAAKYRLVARYKPVLDAGFPGSGVVSGSELSGPPQRGRRENSLPDDNQSSVSSSSSTFNPAEDSDGSAMLASVVGTNPASTRQRLQPRLLGVRQSEELVADMMRRKVLEASSDGNQNLLLGKYYYA